MIQKIKDFPCPFSTYSKKYGKTKQKWEKLYRTGYLWREYDTEELQEYMQILTGYKPTKHTIKKFIAHADINEELINKTKKGQTEFNTADYENISLHY